jgi:hypothetical protein
MRFALLKGWAEGAAAITSWRFDFNNVGTEIPQEGGAKWSGNPITQIQHSNAIEGATHTGSPP